MPTTQPDTIQQTALRDFQQIPGVGPSIAGDLWLLGYRGVSDLRDQNPERMYLNMCASPGAQ